MILTLTIDYKLFYGKPAPNIDILLKGLGRNNLAQCGAHFLGLIGREFSFTPEYIIKKMFGKYNQGYATKVYQRLLEIQDNTHPLFLFHPTSSLLLIEYSLELPEEDQNISNIEFERKIFDLYLALNSNRNNYEADVLKFAYEAQSDQEILFRQVLGNTYSTHELFNYNLNTVIASQFYRAILLYKNLSKDKRFNLILQTLTRNYGISNWQEYLKKLLSFTQYDKDGKTFIIINTELGSKSDKLFIEQLTYEIKKVNTKGDFLQLRDKPLIKLSESKVLVAFDLFLIEKIYKGQYFVLNEINNQIPGKSRLSNLRGIYCDIISEKAIFYEVLTNCFSKWAKLFSGEQMKIAGIIAEPDFYCRDGNNILLFESKDVLIKADNKHSHNIYDILTEISDKLIYDSKERSNKAVKQLIYQIQIILCGGFSTDPLPLKKTQPNRTKALHIFPILVVHDRQLTALGVEYYLRNNFTCELEILKLQGLLIENVRNLVIINIDSLLSYESRLKRDKFHITKLIDEYFIEIKGKTSPKNKEEAFNKITKPFKSFNDFYSEKAKDLDKSIENKINQLIQENLLDA